MTSTPRSTISVATPASDQTRAGGARAPPGNQAIIPRCGPPAGAINRDDETSVISADASMGPVEAGAGAEQRMQHAARSCSVGVTGASGLDVQIAPARVAS